jgi:hypothetical protein
MLDPVYTGRIGQVWLGANAGAEAGDVESEGAVVTGDIARSLVGAVADTVAGTHEEDHQE